MPSAQRAGCYICHISCHMWHMWHMICLVLIVMCHIICDNIHKHDQRIFSGTHQISVALLMDKIFQYFWQIKMLLPFIFLGPPYLISIIFRQMSILHYIWHKPISLPSAEYWAEKRKIAAKSDFCVGLFFEKGISSSDLAVLGKANIYHKPRKTGFGKFVKFLDLISAKYIRTDPFPVCYHCCDQF